MDVRIDEARHERLARGLQHLRSGADHVLARADVRDPLAPDGDVRRVNLPRVDVQERAAVDVEIGVGSAAGNVGEALALGDDHEQRL